MSVHQESVRKQNNHRRKALVEKLQEVIAAIDDRPCEWDGRRPFRTTETSTVCQPMPIQCHSSEPPSYPCVSRGQRPSFGSSDGPYSDPTPLCPPFEEARQQKGRFLGVDVAGHEVYSTGGSDSRRGDCSSSSQSDPCCLYSDSTVQCRLLDQQIRECPECCTTLLCSTIEETTIRPPVSADPEMTCNTFQLVEPQCVTDWCVPCTSHTRPCY